MKKLEGTSYTYTESVGQTNLWQFKQVIETNDVRFLLVLEDYKDLPDVDTTVLDGVWFEIYAGFSEIAGGGRSDLWLAKQKRAKLMVDEYNIGIGVLNMLDILKSPKMIDIANIAGFGIDHDNFGKTFAQARSKLVRLKNTIKSEAKLKSTEKEKSVDYDSLIIKLERYQGYQFIKMEMSVKEFANIYKQYQAWQAEK